MTLEEKVGQLFILGFWGKEPDYYITKMIKERYIGGVILLGYNIDSEQQLKELTDDLQGMSKTPLFISVDQEGEKLQEYGLRIHTIYLSMILRMRVKHMILVK